MALRRSRSNKSHQKTVRRPASRRGFEPSDYLRTPRVESLEDRRMMALGPELVAVQANDGALLRQGAVQNVAPRDLTFRFDDGQIIDPASLAAIQITRTDTSPAQVVKPGFVGIGETPNEVIVRFAETLADGVYRVDIGAGGTQLRNTSGNAYENVGRVTTPFSFTLNLGAQVVAVVPQPITRGANGQLTQASHQIVVYFNDDDLHPVAASGTRANPGPATVTNPRFYQLIFTNDTATNDDAGAVRNPDRVDYNPATDTAVLTFLDNSGNPLPLDQLPTGAGTYRLRIGTDEVLPATPVAVTASTGVRSDFNTNHQVEILLAPDLSVAEGASIAVEVTKNVTPIVAGGPTVPTITVTGRRIRVDLKSDPNNPNRGTTAAELVNALNGHAQASGLLTATIVGGGQNTVLGNRTIDYSPLLLVDPGSRFTAATNLSEFGFSFNPGADGRSKSIIVSSAIDKQFFPLNFPGAQDEPGHRDIAVEGHVSTPLFYSPANTASQAAGTDVADQVAGATTIPYNFRDEYGLNPVSGLPFINVINDAQKQRAREVFEIYGHYLGVQFVETEDQGFIIATGDLSALGGVSQPGGVLGIAGANNLDLQPTAVMDNAESWSDEFGVNPPPGRVSWFETALHEIGHLLGLGHSYDLPPLTVQGDTITLGQSSTGVPFDRSDNILPGDHDILHGQHLYRPDSKDIDLYRFQVAGFGRFTAETFAERLTAASHLDTVITLYRENGDGTRSLIARNDNYFSKDSFLEVDLTPGVYYAAVSASGNIDFDPENGDTGIGGKTDGKYDLRMGFRPLVDAAIVDIDVAGNLPDRQPLDGDADGVPGGVFNFWFRALPAINPNAVTTSSTIYVDKTFQPTPGNLSNGTLARPFNEIDQAIAFINSIRSANPGAQPQYVIRIVGNNGTATNPLRVPYVLGPDPITGQPLADGANLEVPQGVTVMIDEGAIFKMRRSSVLVGSDSPTINRSRGAVQVLGVPNNQVIFTSYDDESVGRDTNPNIVQRPAAGDWGGIVVRNDVDRASGRFDYEQQGVFLNAVYQTDLRYGGGLVLLGSVEQRVAPVFMIDARPTIAHNTITRSAGAAMSANPDSFEESNFHDPRTQRTAYDPVLGDRPFTLDYRRVGPDIHGNRLRIEQVNPTDPLQTLVFDNTLNGLFIRINTPASNVVEKLTVAGRFDDTDIVHILQENLEIEGTPGGLMVERYISAPAPIPLARPAGGTLPAGTYNYFVTFIDADGIEGPRSDISNNSVLTGGPSQGTVRLRIQPPAVGNFASWRLYRSAATGTGPYVLVTEQTTSVTAYDDAGAALGGTYNGAAPEPRIETTIFGGALPDGTFNYFVTFLDRNGVEGPASPLSQNVTITPGTTNRTVRLNIDRPAVGDYVSWRLYRSQPSGRSPYVRVSEQPAATFSYDDDGDFNDLGELPGLEFRGSFVTVERGRLDASLKIDPGLVIKSEGARIEATMGGQIIAEGRASGEVVFTSLRDARYGAGGAFETSKLAGAPAPGDWGGVYVGHTGSGSFDHAVFAYGGGVTRVEGGFANFNVLEIHESKVRVANSLFEFNGDGTRVLDPADDPDRVGRGRNAPGVIFIRGAQPVVVNNVIRNNVVTSAAINPAITINVNALNSDLVTDWGRSTGEADLMTLMPDNQGPLFRGNILENVTANAGAINGLLVRGNVLTTQSVWDDTDIVHVLLNEVLVPDFHSKGGLRLESSPLESLVVKLFGADAGFAANGQPLDIDDRIGGSVQIVGQPGHPVVLTSLRDDTAGAGQTRSGRPQFDTNNDGSQTAPQPGDWRSIRLLQYANDRNVATIVEREANDAAAPGLNAVPDNAQFLGELAPNEASGDDVRRLGFTVHGFLTARSDVDVYSFRARTGTEVWFDIDNTTHALDAVVELIDANGVVIARSANSLNESADPSLLFRNTSRIAASAVNPLVKSAFEIDDHFSTNPRDAGMRIVLPGSANTVGTYHVRVRSANPGVNIPNDLLLGGRSMGRYEMQIRLREIDEVPGSTVTFANIHYATTAIDIQGLPRHSPLLGETAENGTSNQVRANAQNLGNLLRTDRGAISVAGFLDAVNPDDPVVPNNPQTQPNPNDPDDVDWYTFTLAYDAIQLPGQTDHATGIIFDLDFADNLGRPDIRLSVFDSQGQLVFTGDNASVSDDISAPGGGTGARDPDRGSGGPLDAFIGPVQLPRGQYFVAVSHAGDRPAELAGIGAVNSTNPLARIEPLESIVRIAEDRISFTQASTVQPQTPITPLFTDENGNFVGTFQPFNLSDVALFVNQLTGASESTVHIVDAFSGALEATVGRYGFATGDFAMRGDGRIFTYSVDLQGADAPQDADSGIFIEINPGTGAATVLQDDGIQTFEPDAMGMPVRTHPFPPPQGGRIGDGIQFNAIAFNRNASRLVAIGNRGFHPYPFGADYTNNILYLMDPSDFDGDTNAPGLPEGPVRPNPLGRAGTNIRDQGQIPTDVDLVGGGASVLVSPNATGQQSQPLALSPIIIADGAFFDVRVDDGQGNITTLRRFEMNSGPEAHINFDLNNNEFFVDGEIFRLDNLTFEFDTGTVLVPNGFAPGTLTEGAQIVIDDNQPTPVRRVFEITTDPVVQQGAVPLLITNQTTEAQFVGLFVNAVNNQSSTTTFNVTATLSNGRVTLTGDSLTTAPILRNGNTGFNLSGRPGLNGQHPGAIRVFAEETYQPGEIIQQILNVVNGVPGSPNFPGVPNITAGASGTRINFQGAINGDFDSNDTTNAAAPGTARFMDAIPNTSGNVTQGNVPVPFFADDTGEEIAQAIIAAVNGAALNGVTAQGTTPPSRTATFIANPLVHGPGSSVVVAIPPNSPFTRGGAAPGGDVTGAAYINGELYVVSEFGGLYHVRATHSTIPGIFAPVINGLGYVDSDYIESAVDLANLFDPNNPQNFGRRLTGLTSGPPNLQGGAFANTLFGIDNFGRIYAFNTNGTLQPIFQGGATFIDTGIFNANGLDFSTLDYNLWQRTVREQGDPFRFDDLGHGIEPTVTRSRIGPRTIGGSSLYFGNSLPDVANTAVGRSLRTRDFDLDGIADVTSLGQQPGTRLTYDFPGGAHGSAQSAPFSLKGYAAADAPTLYFNYYLETEDANGANMRDSFRVFAASDDPALPADPVFANQVIQGQWYLLATNNVTVNNQGVAVTQDGPSPFVVQPLHDQPTTGGVWRQARIDLSPFAGREDIRLRFDFATGGSMDTPHFDAPGVNARFSTATGGEELKIIPGSQLRDGQTFNISGTTFEFDLGVTLVAPTGDAIADGETFTINDGVILPVNFEFHNDNTFQRNIRTVDGSFFRDGDTFTITDDAGVTQAFEFESGYTIVVPQVGAGPGGIQDGNTFVIDDGLGNPNSVKTYEFDTNNLTNPAHVPININVDQAILIPSVGGGFGGVRDGDRFTIRDQNNALFTFEFDNNNLVGQTGGVPNIRVPFTAVSTQTDVANAVAAAINAQTMNPTVTAVSQSGQVRLGTLAVTVDTSASQALGQQFIAGDFRQIADLIVTAIQGANQGLNPLHTRRAGVTTGEVHIGGTSHTLNTAGTPALRQRGAPGLLNSSAIPVPFVPSQDPPTQGYTASEIANEIVLAINTAFSRGFGVSASTPSNSSVVVLSAARFGFSPGATALTPDGIVPIAFTNSQSAEEVAAAMSAAIANSQLRNTVITHLVGNRINLEAVPPATQIVVTQTPGFGSAVTGVTREGTAGNSTPNARPVRIHSEMTFQQVRDAVAAVLNQTFAPAAAAAGINTFATHDNVIRIQGQTIVNAGPLGATSLATATPPSTTFPFNQSALPGDQTGAFNNSEPALRGTNNRFEGVYVDDIIIGFAERGEMITGPNRGDDTFVHTGQFGTVGAYQLEIRRASEYGSWTEGIDLLTLQRSFDTNDRLSQDFTLFAPSGSQIGPTATFFISDGVDTVTFEYVNQGVPGAQPQPGNVPIFFSPSDSAATVAKRIRDTINSQLVQQNLGLNVTAASLETSDRVDLVGETVLVNIIKPGLTIDSVSTDANALRDALLGPDVTPVGDAIYVGGPFSAGFFSGGTSSIGIERGIVLSTGDVNFAQGPNTSDSSSGFSSQLGDADLDAEFGEQTQDTTILQFDFELDAADARDLFFNFVFASEEYNEFVRFGVNDVFAFFVDGVNIAFVPGTNDPISVDTINGGNPFGTAANNPQFFNNNDRDDGGQFLAQFGLDGFTNVFTAVARDLAPGVHTIKLAISDVGDLIYDSAVFLEVGSFSATPPAQQARQGITGIRHNDIGDRNRKRDQGQVIISNNQIFDTAQFGIVVDAAPRDPVSGVAAPGSPRNLEEINRERLSPGVVISNNVVARSGAGGLRFSGDPGGPGLPPAAVPFGRIVNNTFFGTGSGDVGIQVNSNAGPTLMNNIVANFATGIDVDASSQPNTVVASTLYQNNAVNSNVGLGTNFPVVLNPGDPLFVDPANNNFYLAAGSAAIDSSIDSIQERPTLRNVKQSIGIPPSNVLAPERDALGQLRRDDPSFQPPFGAGQVVFKDRGALDRVDFTGPSAELIHPRDNDAEGLDQNPNLFAVLTSGQLLSQFQIKLFDGREPIDPNDGTGIDASTVTAEKVRIHFVPFDDPNDPTDDNAVARFLNLGTDFAFAYNPLNTTISLLDVGGRYPPGVYTITLDNSPIDPTNANDDGVDAIRDLAGNPLRPNNAQTGQTSFVIEIPGSLDFGDAPESYGTTIDSDGPRHIVRPNFFLGTTVDTELDGNPSIDANGDGADEDGVRFRGQLLNDQPLNVGATLSLEVFASAPGFLDAWIDFNRNGVFDASERITPANGLSLGSAANTVTFSVPQVPPAEEATLLGPTYARFRFSSAGGLGPTGAASDGEVEDYRVVLQRSGSPWQNPSNNLNVNDDRDAAGNPIISILDALLVVSDLRANAALDPRNGSVHRLFPTPAQAAAADPPQLFVTPGTRPFVDVDGNALVTINDVLQVINALRAQTRSGANPEPEAERSFAASALTGEGEAPDRANAESSVAPAASSAAPAPPVGSVALTGARPTEQATRDDEAPASLASPRLGNELLLANASFRTYEFEAALADIAGDVSDAWSSDEGEERQGLDDYFPFAEAGPRL